MPSTPMNERNIVFFPMQSAQIGTDEDNNPIWDNAADAEILQNLRMQEVKNGVYPDVSTYLQVVSNNDMTITVTAGYAHIQGVQVRVKEDEILQVEDADPLVDRMDRVVLRLDLVENEITLAIKQGDTSLTRTNQIWELGLADLAIVHNNAVISLDEITDLRFDPDICGVATSKLGYLQETDTINSLNNGDTSNPFIAALLDYFYPVGTIYETQAFTSAAQMHNHFGGTWAAWGAGRVPVGVDTSDPSFNSVNKEGGYKEVTLTANQSGLRSHTHSASTVETGQHQHTPDSGAFVCAGASGGTSANVTTGGGGFNLRSYTSNIGNHSHSVTVNSVSSASASEAHSNLQPYKTRYAWVRTS